MLRTGPYGDGFGADPTALHARRRSRPSPHGIDLGAAASRASPRCCAPAAGKIELAPEPILADLQRLRGALDAPTRNGGMVLDRPPPPALEQLLDAQRSRRS